MSHFRRPPGPAGCPRQFSAPLVTGACYGQRSPGIGPRPVVPPSTPVDTRGSQGDSRVGRSGGEGRWLVGGGGLVGVVGGRGEGVAGRKS